MSQSTNAAGSGIGFTGLLTVLFIGLKLTGLITWSWAWVLSPIWISVLLVVFILLIYIAIVFCLTKKSRRR